jgi:hypothetical protein
MAWSDIEFSDGFCPLLTISAGRTFAGIPSLFPICCLVVKMDAAYRKYLAFFYSAGSVVMERAANEKSDLAQKLANYNLLKYQFWWDMPFLYWCASFYSNPLILSYRQAYEQGSLLGDGRTATEM